MTIGDRIKKARTEKNWSQAKLGSELGVSQQMIAQIEKGKRNPNAKSIAKIADLLNVSPAWLRYGDSIITTKNRIDQKYIDLFAGSINLEKIVDESISHVLINLGENIEQSAKEIESSASNLVKNIGESAVSAMQDILEPYRKLNEKGKRKAVEYTNDLTRIEEYTTKKEE